MALLLRCPSPPHSPLISAAASSSFRAPRRLLGVRCMAKGTGEEDAESLGGETLVTVAGVGGLLANPVIGASLYALKKTGCGLPPGPGGAFGAIEGVSYLIVAGIVGWSAYTKVKTGKGLPEGPFGLLGAVEGLSYLSVVGIVVVFALQFFEKGFIPGPLPGEQCFG